MWKGGASYQQECMELFDSLVCTLSSLPLDAPASAELLDVTPVCFNISCQLNELVRSEGNPLLVSQLVLAALIPSI